METRLRTQVKPPPVPTFTPVRGGVLQRKCACGGAPGPTGECEACRKKRLQSKIGNCKSEIRNDSAVPPIVHEVLRSPGQPLEPATRAFMEPRFGHDFSNVRVHADAKAAESAWAVNAIAYTVGRDVAFGSGQYAPQTGAGRKLLAHELTHVVQQGSDSAPETAGDESHSVTVGPSQGALEVEAHRMAESYNWHEPPVDDLSHRILQRQEAPAQAVTPEAPKKVCPVTAITPFGPPDAAPAGNFTAATQTALTCLQTAVEAVKGTMIVTTTFRSQAYQDHLVEVWDKVTAPPRTEPECAEVMKNYAAERKTHFPMGKPARGVSNHTNGTAFDATVTLPAGADLNTIQAGCKLTRPVPGEPWHFET
jgi:hypothetical protein